MFLDRQIVSSSTVLMLLVPRRSRSVSIIPAQEDVFSIIRSFCLRRFRVTVEPGIDGNRRRRTLRRGCGDDLNRIKAKLMPLLLCRIL